MFEPYLLQVYSQPYKVSPETWIQWYLEEHIPDMVHFGIAKTGALYRASSPVYIHLDPPKDSNDKRSFLAMYQTNRKKALSYQVFREKVRQTTELWEGGRSTEVGEFAITESESVKVMGTSESNEGMTLYCAEDAASYILQLKIYGAGIEHQIQAEHISPFSKLEGYQQTILYRPQEQKSDTLSFVMLIHAFEWLNSGQIRFLKEQLAAIEATKDHAFQIRSYELLGSEGFQDLCRVPARL